MSGTFFNFEHLPKQFFDPLPKALFQGLPKEDEGQLPNELLAASKAGEICSLVDDLDVMKELYCVLAYALAQHPNLLMDYLETFLNTAIRYNENKGA